MHSFEVSLGYERVDWNTSSCWKCSSINDFIPQWNFKRMHSILITIFKSHQNLIYLNFSLWILFMLDYLLLEITTPLIVYIWRRHWGTRASSDLSCIGMWNFSFIIMWPLHNQSYCNISIKNGSNVIIS